MKPQAVPDPADILQEVRDVYMELAAVGSALNSASDVMGEAIATLDARLGNLHLGVAAWTQIAAGDGIRTGKGAWTRELGYTKVRKWGLALKNSTADAEEIWKFNDAPRWMRIEAVAFLPELLHALVRRSRDTLGKIENRTREIEALTQALPKEEESA